MFQEAVLADSPEETFKMGTVELTSTPELVSHRAVVLSAESCGESVRIGRVAVPASSPELVASEIVTPGTPGEPGNTGRPEKLWDSEWVTQKAVVAGSLGETFGVGVITWTSVPRLVACEVEIPGLPGDLGIVGTAELASVSRMVVFEVDIPDPPGNMGVVGTAELASVHRLVVFEADIPGPPGDVGVIGTAELDSVP